MPTGTGFVQATARYEGTPYVWGGASPRGFDCSGLVYYVLTKLGLDNVPRTSEEQWAWVHRIGYRDLQPGDLIFLNFPGESSPGHVVVWKGAGKVIQAPRPGLNVSEARFTPLPAGSSEWGGTIVGYGRVPGLSYAAQQGGSGPRARPPRPGNANNPGGAADAGTAADTAQGDAWARYASELSPPGNVGQQTANYASIFGIPGTGWVPDWLNPLNDIPGVPGLNDWNPLNWFNDAKNAVSDVTTFLQWIAWLFNPRNILRIVEFVAGAGLIIVGLSFARSDRDNGGSSEPGVVRKNVRRARTAALAAIPGEGEVFMAAKGAAVARSSGQKKKWPQRSSGGRDRIRTKTVFVTDPDDPLARRERLRRRAAAAKPSDDIPF